ncbi:hypothetical protein FRC08_009569 [Ceratobasidium sp. 394]|nr:hypothetical protein FRC08_009569 [Ceratobasidium sp. 394]
MKITKTITIACLCGYTASGVLARDTNTNAVRGIPIVKTALAVIATHVVRTVVVRLWESSQSPGESSKPPAEPRQQPILVQYSEPRSHAEHSQPPIEPLAPSVEPPRSPTKLSESPARPSETPREPPVEPFVEPTSRTSEGLKDQKKKARSSEYFYRMADTWGTVYGKHCVSYGHREYRASFRRAPQGQDPIKACERTRAIINGIKFEAPIACYYRGSEGVVASWHVGSTSTQSHCKPHWGGFENKGCVMHGRST